MKPAADECFALLTPSLERVPSYVDALQRGWSPEATRDETRLENLRAIEDNAVAFVSSLDDPHAKGGPIRLPDGSLVERLPGFHRWMWDGEFCGEIDFRWRPGTPDLPPTCLGHIGYGVVPWKRNRGYATSALRLMLPEARAQGLAYVEITTDPDNIASQRVILANGGALVERFRKEAAHGAGEGLRFRIVLNP
jgi:predicted acetyltransferase